MRPKAPQPLLRLSYLPIDLLGLPIMLILLALMPVGYALSALCLLLLPVLWQLHREGGVASASTRAYTSRADVPVSDAQCTPRRLLPGV